jgi:hypothetical protein
MHHILKPVKRNHLLDVLLKSEIDKDVYIKQVKFTIKVKPTLVTTSNKQ